MLLIEGLELLADLRDWIVLAGIVITKDAHDTDGVIINKARERGGVDTKGLDGNGCEAGLDVHVLEELLPARLVER